MMFRPECCVLPYSLVLYCTMCIDRRLPAPEVDDAASGSGGDEGYGEGDDRQQNKRNDGVIARDNLMRAIFPFMSKLLSHNYSAYVLIDAMLVYNINLYLYRLSIFLLLAIHTHARNI